MQSTTTPINLLADRLDPYALRRDFPILGRQVNGCPLLYLDSAASAQKPAAVIEAMHRFYAEEYATVHRAIYALAAEATERYHAVRRKVQHFLGASSPEEIVFTRGTTDAINLVARSFGETFLQAGDAILIPETEHHSNFVPWQMLGQRRGVQVISVPVDEDGIVILAELEKRLSRRTKLLSLAHVSNFTGACQPLEEIIPMAHAYDCKVFVDAAQSAPHMPLDVEQMDADFLAFSGHKAFGPTGIGVLYGKYDVLAAMPPVQGGGDMIERVAWEYTSFQKPPLKFEAGTPMIAEVLGLGAALDYIEQLGRDRIAAWEAQLTRKALELLQTVPGMRIIGNASDRGPIISFVIDGCHPLDIGTLLDLKGIAVRTGHLCTQPGMQRFGLSSAVRISFAPYNTLEEIDLFIAALRDIQNQLYLG